MKSIINTISFLIASLGITFWATEDNQFHHKISGSKQFIEVTQNKMDSVDKEILHIHERTNQKLESDNKVLQNTKKELMYMDIRLDRISAKSIMENNSDYVLPTLK